MTGMTFVQVYDLLYRHYGPQHWWPADTPFEVMVGAVLTQNTAWSNVEQAITNLKQYHCLTPERIVSVRESTLASWLRPSGYFNIKAKRLRNFCRWYLQSGGYNELNSLGTSRLRKGLLSINGVGPETADDILLYAFHRPVFVIDAYTRRIFNRLGLIEEDVGYEYLRSTFEENLPEEAALLNEYHALIVMHGKEVCRKRPLCLDCLFRAACPSSTAHS